MPILMLVPSAYLSALRLCRHPPSHNNNKPFRSSWGTQTQISVKFTSSSLIRVQIPSHSIISRWILEKPRSGCMHPEMTFIDHQVDRARCMLCIAHRMLVRTQRQGNAIEEWDPKSDYSSQPAYSTYADAVPHRATPRPRPMAGYWHDCSDQWFLFYMWLYWKRQLPTWTRIT